VSGSIFLGGSSTLRRRTLWTVALGGVGCFLGWVYGRGQVGSHQEPLFGLLIGSGIGVFVLALGSRGFRRALGGAFLGAAAGSTIGWIVGLIWVSTWDCPASIPNSCEWSGLVPLICSFWGIVIGIVIGVSTTIWYHRRRSVTVALPPPPPQGSSRGGGVRG
jgi:hypothetical protein